MVPLYTVTSLTSALLLFLIQPMFTKMTLPLLGGTPAVWNTAMVFFQVVLLLGYAYTHLSYRWLGAKKQSLLQIAVLILAAMALPVSVSKGLAPHADDSPVIGLLLIYTLSIGLPFFALSAMSPMLQKWFSQTGHRHADNPYFLYAASNVGSLLALLSYPVLIEPSLGLAHQGIVWAILYGVFILFIAVCIWTLSGSSEATSTQKVAVPGCSWRQRVNWAILAFIPSSLLLSVTTHMTTDLPSVPFLWILPLSLFLLTFVVVFSRVPLLKHQWMLSIHAILMVLFVFFLEHGFDDIRLNILLHLSVFFVSAMVCHGQLAASKPGSESLTEFYLFMSIGGALGGIFTAIIAPLVFSSVYEYPIGLLLVCLIRPVLKGGQDGQLRYDILLPVLIGTACYLVFRYGLEGELPESTKNKLIVVSLLFFATMVFGFRARPLRFTIGIAIIMLFGHTLKTHTAPLVDAQRSFFAIHKIIGDPDNQFLFLKHGTTIHGTQSTEPSLWRTPFSYYHENGPAGQLFRSLNKDAQYADIGLVGLGLGAMTCYQGDGQDWRIFEIDPVVVDIARDTRYFHYLEQCGDDMPIVLGDARLSLQNEPDQHFDALILDAFSSDSIPIHLMTDEAIELYLSKLGYHGILLAHISNRHLDLAPVFARHAVNRGLYARSQLYPGDPDNRQVDSKSLWIALSRNESSLDRHAGGEKWKALQETNTALWTDDYSNLWQIVKWPE